MTSLRSSSGTGFAEFVVLMALIVSMVALSIDAMLPALPDIANDLGVSRLNDSQYVITVFFAGMAFGQILFGPLSDSVGRKPAIISGMLLFAAGCVLSILADSFWQMLLGRFLQGLGAAGPRIVSIAVVRDRYKGREMARVMSFIMTVFILVPVFAPALGQGILLLADWQYIFFMFLALALFVGSWFWWRQPETLAPEARQRLSLARLLIDIRGIVRNRAALGNSFTMGLYFGILACAIGFASLVNARLVMRLGMRRLSSIALAVICLLSFPFLAYAWIEGGRPPFYLLMAYLLVVFFFFGILFGNLNALAMEPLGHIAGLGSSVIGFISTLISVVFGVVVSDAYDGTVLPLVAGFALLSLLAMPVFRWSEAPQG